MTLKIKDADGVIKHVAATGTGTADDPIKTQQSITGAVAINQALPPGENSIGKVEVTAMPPLSVGDINVEVGEVAVSNFPTSFQVSNFPTSFEIGNFPDTQAVAGSLSVSNFPTSFQVSNLPATQTISGSVAVSNFPASFQVSDFPTSFEISNLPATQTIAGSVSVSNFPTSFQVSNLPSSSTVSMSAITTDGTSGDKTILTPSSGKALRISSLCLVMTNATAITLKKASTAISGAMTISELATDFPQPVALAIDQAFVINVGSAVAVNGFLTWWEV